ncbi:hypothetical protein J6590_107518, partial [Homalodisca vitripennis]
CLSDGKENRCYLTKVQTTLLLRTQQYEVGERNEEVHHHRCYVTSLMMMLIVTPEAS